MDIVTHGMMGVVIAAPFMADYPEASIAFMMGSAAPDLDAMSRIAGRRSFLKFHQTYSHAFPVIAAIAAAAYVVSAALGFPGHHVALGLALGMCFHSVLDFSNTYGITLLAPFSDKRFCREWVFFIDLPVIAVTVAALYVIYSELARAKMPGLGLAYAYVAFLFVYWMVRIVLRRRAGRLAPEGTVSLLPTAFIPWKFIGARPLDGEVHLFDSSAVRGRLSRETLQKIHDGPYATILEGDPGISGDAGALSSLPRGTDPKERAKRDAHLSRPQDQKLRHTFRQASGHPRHKRCRARRRAQRLVGRRAGFRFWWQDAVAIVLCALVTWLSWRPFGPVALLFPVTLGHFFLFCNVFRLRRSYELFWNVLFLTNIGFWLFHNELHWAGILALQTPLTIALILLEMRSPNYHSVFWARLNPGYGGGFDASESETL